MHCLCICWIRIDAFLDTVQFSEDFEKGDFYSDVGYDNLPVSSCNMYYYGGTFCQWRLEESE